MAKDFAKKLAMANRNIDQLVSALNHVAQAFHVLHGGADSMWQDCEQPTCQVAQLALQRVMDSEQPDKKGPR